MSDTELQPRIVGLETEYAWCYTARPDIGSNAFERRSLRYPGARPTNISSYPLSGLGGGAQNDVFLSNGARYYLDVDEHWEYATPECTSFSDAVAYDAAGDEYVTRHLSHPVFENLYAKQMLNKRVVDHQEMPETAGAHENYMVSGEHAAFIGKEFVLGALTAHLVTRSVFVGAGSVDFKGNFYKTQKIHTTKTVASRGTTNSTNKPIVNLRDEPHMDPKFGFRLHITSGDPNVSPWATWMKLGTTSIVLRLIEEDMINKDLSLENPNTAAALMSRGVRLDTPLALENGDTKTALDIQDEFIESAKTFDDKVGLPAEEKEVLAEWIEARDDLRQDPDRCIDRIDWIYRWHTIDGHEEEKAKKHDLVFDMLLPVKGLGMRRREDGQFRRTPSSDRIEYCMQNPPSTTRALLRGRLVTYLASSHLDGKVKWDHLALGGRDYGIKDPYNVDVEHLEDWIEDVVLSR